MNLVIDETVEETKDGSKNSIGMVVSDEKTKLTKLVILLKSVLSSY